jgi:uncharacterized membrane protein HdeD (DUF308 family)
MPKYIYSLPNLLIILLTIMVIQIFSHWVPHIISMVYDFHQTGETIKISQLLAPLLGATVGVLIGFLLNQAQSNFQAASALVASEASQINNLDRLLLRFGDDYSLKVRSLLKVYLESVIDSEWPQLKLERGCKQTHLLWRSISQKIFKLEPASPKQVAIYSDILNVSESVSEAREVRIDRSTQKLPVIFWVAILFIFLGISSLTALAAPGTELNFGRKVFPVIYGSLLGLLIIFDQPFKGGTSVKSNALKKVLESIKTRSE